MYPPDKCRTPTPKSGHILEPPLPVEKRPIFGGLFYTEKTPNK